MGVSVGIAVAAPGVAASPDELLATADREMYVRKRTRRREADAVSF